jgi:hypothetical protein
MVCSGRDWGGGESRVNIMSVGSSMAEITSSAIFLNDVVASVPS